MPGRRNFAFVHGFDNLTHQAADDHPLAVAHGVEGVDQGRGPHAAQATHCFDEEDLGSQSGRTDGGGRTARTTTADDEIVAAINGDLAGEGEGVGGRFVVGL